VTPTPEARACWPDRIADGKAARRLKNAVGTGPRAAGDASCTSLRPMRDLKGWGVEQARRLIGPADPHHAAHALYGGSLMQASGTLLSRLEAEDQPLAQGLASSAPPARGRT